jgi:hypothetical protein
MNALAADACGMVAMDAFLRAARHSSGGGRVRRTALAAGWRAADASLRHPDPGVDPPRSRAMKLLSLIPLAPLAHLMALTLAGPAWAEPRMPSAESAPAPTPMQRYLIERDMPGAGKLTLTDLRGGAAKSNAVLRQMGTDIQWVQSYVAGDKVYCVYNATSESLLRQHAALSGFPATKISAVSFVVDPTTEGPPR